MYYHAHRDLIDAELIEEQAEYNRLATAHGSKPVDVGESLRDAMQRALVQGLTARAWWMRQPRTKREWQGRRTSSNLNSQATNRGPCSASMFPISNASIPSICHRKDRTRESFWHPSSSIRSANEFVGFSSFRDQLTRSGLSIPSNIAEGYKRDSDAEIARFLTIAKGSAGELRTQILIGIEAGYLAKEDALVWADEAAQLGRIMTPLNLDNELYERASKAAAAEGKTVDDFVVEALQHALSDVCVRRTQRNGLPVMSVNERVAEINPEVIRLSLAENGF